MALVLPLMTTSDGGPGHRPVVQPEPPAVPPPGTNEGDWTCWNVKNVKGMPSTMHGISVYLLCQAPMTPNFKVYQEHFHVQSLKASPVTIICQDGQVIHIFSLINLVWTHYSFPQNYPYTTCTILYGS